MQNQARPAIDASRAAPPWQRRVPRAYVWLGLLSAALTGLYLAFLFSAGSDGARLSKSAGAISSRGLTLHVPAPQPGGLQDGDRLLAIDGAAVADWPAPARPPALGFRPGQTAVYTIVRAGEVLDVTVTMGAQPLASLVAEHWSILLYALVSQIIGVFMLWQRPHIPAARALFVWGATSSHIYIWSSYYQPGDLYFGGGLALTVICMMTFFVANWPAALHLALVFPEPLPLVQRRPWVIPVLYAASATIYAAALLAAWQASSHWLDWIGAWRPIEVLLPILTNVPMVACIAVQYRRHRFSASSRSIQWVIFSALFAGMMGLALYLVPEFLRLPSLGISALGLVILPFPVSFALAIWRFHLFDIELILNRALVYSALTTLLGLIYLTSIITLQALVGAAGFGPGELSQPVVVASTLLTTVLFSPLRRRLQEGIDRRFYRRKYNREQVVQTFGEQLRQQLDYDSLTGYILTTVEETLQPERASLWMRAPRRPAGVDGAEARDESASA